MNFARFFPIQKGLDHTILKEKNIQEPPPRIKKLLSLMVEIGEMANETRCFKYWSDKPPAPKKTILEEYADCMHFLLGIGIEYGYARSLDSYYFQPKEKPGSLSEEIFNFYERVILFKNHATLATYRDIWDQFLQVGHMLRFTITEIERAYVAKNEVNLSRQANGY